MIGLLFDVESRFLPTVARLFLFELLDIEAGRERWRAEQPFRQSRLGLWGVSTMAEVETEKDKRWVTESDLTETEPEVCRLIFIRDYTLKSLRLKQEKWNKLGKIFRYALLFHNHWWRNTFRNILKDVGKWYLFEMCISNLL